MADVFIRTLTDGRSCEDTGEGGHVQVKERRHKRNQSCGHLDLGLPDSGTVRKCSIFYCLSELVCGSLLLEFKQPGLVHFLLL
jgi:hypothetical protein